ncbi:MAG: DUF4115 domain-containing protein [Cocleimonas sp.]|nr:DUF4115 domain-containing protein [Cocleimonas sp.]
MAKNKEEVSIPVAETGELGALLKGLRDKIGYTIPQTADAMCLSEHTIRQLENEEFDSLPEPPYIRGYLRNYAKLAETDSEEIINCYESLRGADPSDLQHNFKRSSIINSQQKKGLSPVLLQLFFLALLLGLLAAATMVPAVNQWMKSTWESFSSQTTSQSGNATDNPLLTGTMPVPTPLPTDINSEKNEISQKKPSSTPDKLEEKPVTNGDNNESKQVVADKKKSTTDNIDNNKDKSNIKVGKQNKDEAQIPSSSDGEISLKLVFNKEVWMRIKDGNKKTVFEGQNRSGQEKTLKLKKPLTFRVGNAQGLSLFVNGKAVDIKGYTKGSVANFTLE